MVPEEKGSITLSKEAAIILQPQNSNHLRTELKITH